MWCVYNNREEKCDVRYNMVARFLDHNNLSWQRQHLHRQMMQERYRLYRLRWATVLFLSAIRHRNVIHVNFFIFFCHICRTTVYWDPWILLARQSDINNFSSLHQAKQHRCQPLHEECLFCSTFPLPFSTKTTPTAHNSTQSLIIPLHQWCSCAHDHKYPQYRGTAVRMQCLVGTCCWPRSSLYL